MEEIQEIDKEGAKFKIKLEPATQKGFKHKAKAIRYATNRIISWTNYDILQSVGIQLNAGQEAEIPISTNPFLTNTTIKQGYM